MTRDDDDDERWCTTFTRSLTTRNDANLRDLSRPSFVPSVAMPYGAICPRLGSGLFDLITGHRFLALLDSSKTIGSVSARTQHGLSTKKS